MENDLQKNEPQHLSQHSNEEKKRLEKELERLQLELVKLLEWIKAKKLKVVILFEGRDAAGKGGVIKRVMEYLNPRFCRVVALGIPTEKEKTQWYFQRYVKHLPAAGEMVLFDRSWYNRIIRSGIILIKYWFSVSDEEQERRFQERIHNRAKRWKISPMDVLSRSKWLDYSKAKDTMFQYTDIKQAPWYVVKSDNKLKARLNCIHHLLSLIPYDEIEPENIELPVKQSEIGYIRPPVSDQTFVPEVY